MFKKFNLSYFNFKKFLNKCTLKNKYMEEENDEKSKCINLFREY